MAVDAKTRLGTLDSSDVRTYASFHENGFSNTGEPVNYQYKSKDILIADQNSETDHLYRTADQNKIITNIFRNTKDFKDVSKYRLMRGVPDFGSLVQFNPYETGYAIFLICQMPRFIERLARTNEYYRKLMVNWMHIIEYEFKSFDGLEAMSTDTIQLGDDLNNINVISKVNMQSASEFSLTYDEKSGSPLTKFARLYLSGVKDPRTQVKNYHGLIHSDSMDPGFENEVFTFMFIATDNTMREVEAAYLLLACQLNSADTDMYNFTKGDIAKKDVTVKFSGYPVQSAFVDLAARDLLNYLIDADAGARQIIINSNNFRYTGLDKVVSTLNQYGDTVDAEELEYLKYPTGSSDHSGVPYATSDFYAGATNSNESLVNDDFNI